MDELRLEPLSATNISAANSLSLKPGQDRFIAPTTYVNAAGTINQANTWERVVTLGGKAVGYVQANFDDAEPRPEFRACLWRINVAADAQGKGVGRFAVAALRDEAKARGFDHVTVMWEPGEAGPGAFFEGVGFAPVGESEFGDVIGQLAVG